MPILDVVGTQLHDYNWMMKIPTIAKLDKSMGQVQFGNLAKFHC